MRAERRAGHPGPGARCGGGVRRSTGCSCTGATAGRHGAPKPTRGGWDSPVPAKLLAPCLSHPQEEAQGTDWARGTGAAGSRCKWCAASAGPAAAWHGFGTCCAAQRGCRIPPLCSCLPLPFPSPCLAPYSAPKSPFCSRCIRKSGQREAAGTALPAERSGCLKLWAPRPDTPCLKPAPAHGDGTPDSPGDCPHACPCSGKLVPSPNPTAVPCCYPARCWAHHLPTGPRG